MGSPVRLYQEEMHNNVGFFATWLPSSAIRLGDIGVFEDGRFRRLASLDELGTPIGGVREGRPESMSYSACANRKAGGSAAAGVSVSPQARPLLRTEVSINFSRQGGYVFEAAAIRSMEISDRMTVSESVLRLHQQKRWQRKWLLVDAVFEADSATILVSEEASSEIVLNASSELPAGPLPLTDPRLGLSISTVSGKVVHVVAQTGLTPLYSCMRIKGHLFGLPTVAPVRGMQGKSIEAFERCGLADLLES